MRYQVGGTLHATDPTYVERQTDINLLEALIAGRFCYVLNSRQMGKSSLMVRTKYRLQQAGHRCAMVDLTSIGSKQITPVQWYKGLLAELWHDLPTDENTTDGNDFQYWWQTQGDVSLPQKFSRFIADRLLTQHPNDHFYIFLDEVDNVLGLPFSVDDFFAAIRYCYNRRAVDPRYHRITFAMFGVASPADLLQDKQRTPFNIGQALSLDGFSLAETTPLALGLQELGVSSPPLADILRWTGGQPFLTQKICQLLTEVGEPPTDLDTASRRVDWVVQTRLIDNWEANDEPEHLRTIRDRILNQPTLTSRLLGLYQQILADQVVPFDSSQEQTELLLSGVVANRQGCLKVKNPIYRAIFNHDWVTQQLSLLRPYSEPFTNWIASQQKDSSHLLSGLALQEAMAWADEKQLSDLDYRFLRTSQQQEQQRIETQLAEEQQQREQIQFALGVTREAHQVIAAVKLASRQRVKRLRLPSWWVLLVGCGTALLVWLLCLTGWLQSSEWTLLDSFFQLRQGTTPMDPRITLVTIDEADLQQVGRYPIPDEVIVDALQKLEAQQPRQIGLVFYRDLPVEPGTERLHELFATMSNVIGIEKVIGNQVAAPAQLTSRDQVGFTDQVFDADGNLRRALLSLRTPDGNLHHSLALKLTLNYLEAIGIHPHESPQSSHTIRLGQTTLRPFRHSSGGYVRADDGGYQILINYWGTQSKFQTYSLQQILTDKVPDAMMRDRLVLIGPVAESIQNLVGTPYNNSWFGRPQEEMAGVTVHANIISQLLAAALDKRPLLHTGPEVYETLWGLMWTLAGAGMAWWLKSLRCIFIAAITGLITLLALCYTSFLAGLWLPIFSAGLGWSLAMLALIVITHQQLKRIQLQQTVQQLITISREKPAVGQIALEYLQQTESEENQKLIRNLLARRLPHQPT
ncbi:CHASE2 domain-containing protein [Leptolyngbya cf. ectocarpi LEGE 11479]|uniref:CHASE2 domain-containing protein n=1 Tax=Leptolyngbya cf. ectocarpi LEGE 11479 TaxID=1828722 RepID=A0A928ZVN1_LEPEC|nr:CHASE2 domain-containing protein [Leptolyngbya ectocarpi]MBE9068327.1 CHASE2 domain-containing protein [Leptolyngbya cf. ectocarpi LEGE 11479]